MNKGYQEDMTLEHLSATNSSYCNLILNSFKLYCHFSKQHWKWHFIVMLKQLHFYEKKHCASPKGLILLFRKPGKFGVEWVFWLPEISNLITCLLSCHFFPLFCQWFKVFYFTSTNAHLLNHLCLLANNWRHFCKVCCRRGCSIVIEHHLNTTTICTALVVKSFIQVQRCSDA